MKLNTRFDFDAAHRLVGYDGKCNFLHGHRWEVHLEINGDDKHFDDVGILWDFTNRKKLKEYFDHKTILKDCEENRELGGMITFICGDGAIYWMDENSTAENLCYEILKLLKQMDDRLSYKIKVYESPNSYCEIDSEDLE